MVMFAWGAVIFVNYTRPPANAMEINVIGKQWMWKVQHPDGQREINELHVPVNQPVRLTMTSQDVIHDFGLPAFRIKMDVLPGRYTSEWFEATVPGEYHLFCDQYCGTQHSRMVGKVVVMEADKYQAWLSGARQNVTTVEAGQALFKEYSCVNCHSQEAPTMANVYGSVVKVWQDGKLIDQKADDWYIRDSIVNPNHQIVDGYQPLMPSYKGRLSEEQILQLVAYIKTLGVGHQGGRVDKLKMLEATPPPMVETPHPRRPDQVDRPRTDDRRTHRSGAAPMTTVPYIPSYDPRETYLNSRYSVASPWLLTKDHKRIAILYILSLTFFFLIGGAAATMMRIELMNPHGYLLSDDTYNKMFTTHGVMMVFFFLVPSIPATLGNFLVPLHDRGQGPGLPQDQPASAGTCTSAGR